MYSLLSHNTFGIDVSAERFQEYASVEELKTLIAQGALTTPFLHIGGGSNLLFAKNFLDRFNDLALLADLMGHESIETTRIYLRRTASEQQKIVDKVVNW